VARPADPRRRAKQARRAAPPGASAPAEPGSWTAGDETLTFPGEDDGEAQGRARIALPSSGLAADILARPDAASVGTAPAAVVAVEKHAAAAEAAPSPVHSISFFSAPVREERKAAEATEHLATFFLGDEEYGVDVRVVQEIIRVTEITQVPRAPEFVKGVINLRGRIIPVVDLKRKLGLGEVALGRTSRVVVVKLRERLIGLLVDGASQVLKVAVSCIEAAPDEIVDAAIEQSSIRGVAKLEKRLIILIDLARILALELREDSAASSP
jgi:purine-binding chemotaxis protein CheW